MSILTSTHCGILGYKLTDKIIQQNDKFFKLKLTIIRFAN